MGQVDTPAHVFNTPLEAGLRALFLLVSSGRRALDIDRIMHFDYILVHTTDFGGPPSLHPPSPSRGSQAIVRRALLQDGLELMRSRELIERKYAATGIRYRATDVGRHVANQFSSGYGTDLLNRAAWVAQTMGDLASREVRQAVVDRVNHLERELVDDLRPGVSS
jgi:hypothetical protein